MVCLKLIESIGSVLGRPRAAQDTQGYPRTTWDSQGCHWTSTDAHLKLYKQLILSDVFFPLTDSKMCELGYYNECGQPVAIIFAGQVVIVKYS